MSMSTESFNDAVDQAKDWILSKHCTLWMDWDINEGDGLNLAANWLIRTMDEFVSYVEDQVP